METTQAAGRRLNTTSEPGRPFQRIEVGIDGSPGAAAALHWAARLAGATGAEVLAVYVIEPDLDGVRPLGLARAVLNEADWRHEIAAEVEGTWCWGLAASGVRHRTRVEEGRAGPCLAEVARQEHADLVVTGRRGLTSLAELLHGSVSSFVTHNAPCPVVVVPAEAQAD